MMNFTKQLLKYDFVFFIAASLVSEILPCPKEIDTQQMLLNE